MLYVGCTRCGSVGPFLCAGKFMFHAPVPTEPSPMGPMCAWCGVLAPMFTCGVCGTTQGLYVPGMTVPPAQGAGIAPLVAPAVQAPEAASPHQLKSGFESAVNEFMGSFGKQLGQNVANSMSTWTS
jgi:hypothetical protein